MERSGCRSGLWVAGAGRGERRSDGDDDGDGVGDDDGDDDGGSGDIIGDHNGTWCPENLFSGGEGGGSITTTRDGSTSSSSSRPRMMLLGSASIAVEPDRDADRASAGRNLAIAEWGERRIVRLEHGTGARTPLVISVPTGDDRGGGGGDDDDDDDDGGAGGGVEGGGGGGGQRHRRRRRPRRRRRRVYRPNHLTYTPFGDLIFSDTFFEEGGIDDDSSTTATPLSSGDDGSGGGDASSDRAVVGAVYRRREAVHVPPIPVESSRDAHGWTGTTGAEDRRREEEDDDEDDDGIDVLFRTADGGSIEGMVLGGSDFASLYVLVATRTAASDRRPGGWRKMLYSVPIGSDEEDEDEGEDDGGAQTDVRTRGVALLHEMTSSDCEDDDAMSRDVDHSPGSKLAIDERGVVYLVACRSSVTLLSPSRGGGVRPVGALALDDAASRIGRSGRRGASSELTSVGFGEDGYLYVTSANELFRVRSRVGGLSPPTNLIIPPTSKRKGAGGGD